MQRPGRVAACVPVLPGQAQRTVTQERERPVVVEGRLQFMFWPGTGATLFYRFGRAGVERHSRVPPTPSLPAQSALRLKREGDGDGEREMPSRRR